MSEWSIDSGREGDLRAVLDLWWATAAPTKTDSAEALALLLGQDPGALIVARAGGEPIGSLIAAWDGWRGSFYRLAVHPEWQGRGIGRALVEEGERRLRSRGAVRLTAIVIGGDLEATGFWEAVGYERQADRCRFVRMVGG